jgi:urease accessory protein
VTVTRKAHVTAVLGDEHDPAFLGRDRDELALTSVDATRHRQRSRSASGVDVIIELPRGTYLADGAVLADDGGTVIVARRRPESAVVVTFAADRPVAEAIASAARLGHAFGNQHTPIEVHDREVRIPVRTTVDIVRSTIDQLDLAGVDIRVATIPLGRHQRLDTVGAHDHQTPS